MELAAPADQVEGGLIVRCMLSVLTPDLTL